MRITYMVASEQYGQYGILWYFMVYGQYGNLFLGSYNKFSL